jgi:hypothetical protein
MLAEINFGNFNVTRYKDFECMASVRMGSVEANCKYRNPAVIITRLLRSQEITTHESVTSDAQIIDRPYFTPFLKA